MKTIILKSVFLAWALLAFMGAASASAGSYVYGSGTDHVAGGGYDQLWNMPTTYDPVYISGDSGTLMIPHATGESKFQASFGSLGVYVYSWAENTFTEVYGANGASHTGWFDTWKLSAPGMSGQGHLVLGFPVSGFTSGVNPSAGTDAHFTLGISESFWGATTLVYQGHAPGVYSTPPMTFYWDQNFTVEVTLDGNSNGAGGIAAISDFYSTAKCCLFAFVDSNGNPIQVSGLDVLTDSGHDYKLSAVPEPGSLSLILAGLPLAGVLRRFIINR